MFRRILESYSAVPFIAVGAAFMWPEQLSWISAYGAWCIAGIFFLSTLKIDMGKIFGQFSDKAMLATETLLMLIIFPCIIYGIALYAVPELALPLLILAAMPAGMTSPFLVELAGGRQSLAIVVTILTSLLAPLSVPLVIQVLAGAHVEVPYQAMMISLATIIILPMACAQFVRIRATRLVEKTHRWYRVLSIVLLGALIAGVVAKQVPALEEGFRGGSLWLTAGAIIACFVGFHILGYYAPFWRDRRDRITSAVCLSYMNFTLAVYLADRFFPDPSVMVPIVLSVIPWALLFVPFKILVARPAVR